MPVGPIGLSYPKHRSTQQVVVPFSYASAGETVAVLPKDAVVSDVHVAQITTATVTTITLSVGLGATATALVNGMAMTTSVNFSNPDTKIGTSILTKLTSDTKVTVTASTNTADAGSGLVVIDFFQAGPGEAVTD